MHICCVSIDLLCCKNWDANFNVEKSHENDNFWVQVHYKTKFWACIFQCICTWIFSFSYEYLYNNFYNKVHMWINYKCALLQILKHF
jgi:hypothetical protein